MKGYIHVKKKVHTPNMLQDIPYEELQFCAKNEVNPRIIGSDILNLFICREKLAPIALSPLGFVTKF